jgi:hypothetical protein
MPRGAVGVGGRCEGAVGGEDDGGVLSAMLMLFLLLMLQLAVVVSKKEILVVERAWRRDLVLLSTVLAALTGADAHSTAIGSRNTEATRQPLTAIPPQQRLEISTGRTIGASISP